jgi:hypothetical protein
MRNLKTNTPMSYPNLTAEPITKQLFNVTAIISNTK